MSIFCFYIDNIISEGTSVYHLYFKFLDHLENKVKKTISHQIARPFSNEKPKKIIIKDLILMEIKTILEKDWSSFSLLV